MGLFGTAHKWQMKGGGGVKPALLKFVTHTIPCNLETWHSYTLPKEDPKNI